MDYSMRRDGITQSMITRFMRCPYMGILGMAGWEGRSVEDRVRLGNICHHVLEGLYAGHEPSEREIDWLLDEAREKLRLGENRDAEGVEIDLAKAEVLMKRYIVAWPDDFNGKVFLESEMIFDVQWNGFRLRGKIDALYLDKKDARWFMEHKARGRVVEDKLLTILAVDFQTQFYLTAWEAWKGQRLRGNQYNIVRNPGTRPHVGEDLLTYKTRLRTEVAKKPAYYFVRFPISYTNKDRDEFEGELITKLAYIERLVEGKQPPFRVQTACDGCDYVDLCIKGNATKYRKKPLFSELEE